MCTVVYLGKCLWEECQPLWVSRDGQRFLPRHTGCRGFWQWPQQQKTPGFAASTSPQALLQLFLLAACTAVPGGAQPFIRDTLPHSYLAPEEAPSLFWGGQLLILAWPPAFLQAPPGEMWYHGCWSWWGHPQHHPGTCSAFVLKSGHPKSVRCLLCALRTALLAVVVLGHLLAPC